MSRLERRPPGTASRRKSESAVPGGWCSNREEPNQIQGQSRQIKPYQTEKMECLEPLGRGIQVCHDFSLTQRPQRFSQRNAKGKSALRALATFARALVTFAFRKSRGLNGAWPADRWGVNRTGRFLRNLVRFGVFTRL